MDSKEKLDKAYLELQFGALVPRISEQLESLGLPYKTADAMKWQKDADAITRLAVRQLLPESAARNARMKLLKKIIKQLEAAIKRVDERV